MLVLTRRLNEAIICEMPDGRRIRLQVVECRGGRCRIGIDAPWDVPVYREEVQKRIDGEPEGGKS